MYNYPLQTTITHSEDVSHVPKLQFQDPTFHGDNTATHIRTRREWRPLGEEQDKDGDHLGKNTARVEKRDEGVNTWG
jgi:hypothetical protein